MRWGRSFDAVGLLRVLLVASVAGPVVLLSVLGWFTYRAAFDDARAELLWTSEVAREHAAKVFDSFRLASDRTQDLLGVASDDVILQTTGTLRMRLSRMIDELPQIESLIVLDRDARLLVTTSAQSVDRSLDFSDRDYVQALRSGQATTFISKVQTSRISGKTFFGWGRSRFDAENRWSGVIDIAASPDFFARFYDTLISEVGDGVEGRVVAMVRSDGEVLVRYPIQSGPPPRVAPNNPFFDAIRKTPDGGVYTNASLIERTGPERLFAFQKVPSHPVYIVAGRATEAIVAEWRTSMTHAVTAAVPVTAALFLVTLAALRGLWRERAALAQAKAEMNRREQVEEQLRQSQKIEAIGQLTGGIAHDFNNLLTVIRSSTDLLRRPEIPEERRRRYIEAISVTTDRATKLTGQLLAFARRQALKPESFDVVENVRAVADMMRAIVASRIRVETRVPDEPLSILADPSQFDAALVNLAVNARDATPGDGVLTIGVDVCKAIPALRGHAAVPGDYVAVSVADTGSGIDHEHMLRIFEPFFTTKQKGEGTGLGLSQVFGFAKQSQGDIAVESERGRGTTFTLYLPRVVGLVKSTPPSPAEANAPGKCLSVLVVEDDPAVADAVAATLTELGHRPHAIGTGEDALALLTQPGSAFDIVFSDVMMPGMTGLELARRVRTLSPQVAVLLTSGFSDVLDADAETVGAEILRKPYTIDLLDRALREAEASLRRSEAVAKTP